jgi:hypothetical protein
MSKLKIVFLHFVSTNCLRLQAAEQRSLELEDELAGEREAARASTAALHDELRQVRDKAERAAAATTAATDVLSARLRAEEERVAALEQRLQADGAAATQHAARLEADTAALTASRDVLRTSLNTLTRWVAWAT